MFLEGKQSDLFARSLILSLVIHVMVLGGWSLFPKTPQFSVTVGPTSMEIIVLEAKATSRPEVLSFNSEQKVLNKNSQTKDDISGDTFFKQTIEKLPQRIVREKQLNSEVTDWTEFPSSPGAVVEARPLAYVNEPPRYPHLARKKGWEGTVVVKTKVGKNGTPSEIQIEQSSGHRILDDSALKAVREWKFSPAQSGTLRFSSWIRIPVKFELVDF